MKQSANYFSLLLMRHIIEDFPERVTDENFISQRSELANQTYTDCSKQGMSHEEAMHEAMTTLYQGLHFSPYQMMRRVVEEEFADSNGDEAEQGRFIMQMLERCQPVFNDYSIQSEDFIGSPEEKKLYTELTGEVAVYLKENGLE